MASAQSHPTWVRGLKLLLINGKEETEFVAPYVGAWIETHSNTETTTL